MVHKVTKGQKGLNQCPEGGTHSWHSDRLGGYFCGKCGAYFFKNVMDVYSFADYKKNKS